MRIRSFVPVALTVGLLAAPVFAQETEEEAAAPQEAVAPTCEDRETLLDSVQSGLTQETVEKIDNCFAFFNDAIREFGEAEDEDGFLSSVEDEALFRIRYFQQLARRYEAGGELSRSMAATQRVIDRVRADIESYGPGQEEARLEQEAELEILVTRLETQTNLVQEYRRQIAAGMREITNTTPVIINELRLNRLDEALGALETANQAAGAIIGQIFEEEDQFDTREGN